MGAISDMNVSEGINRALAEQARRDTTQACAA